MWAWEQTSTAWPDHAGAWQPAGLDVATTVAVLPLDLRPLAALPRGDVLVLAATPGMAGSVGPVQVAAGILIETGFALLGLVPGAGAVVADAAADVAAGRLLLGVFPAANRDEGWREWAAGRSGPAPAAFRSSWPTVRADLASPL